MADSVHTAHFNIQDDDSEQVIGHLSERIAQMGRNAEGKARVALFRLGATMEHTLASTGRISEEMSAADEAYLKFAKNLQHVALQGNVSANSLQKLSTTLTALSTIAKLPSAEMRRFGTQLNELQNQLARTQSEIRSTASAATGLPQPTEEAAQKFIAIQSASQGVMLGMGLMQRSIMSVGFSLIFLRFTMIPIVALFTAMTIALMSAGGLVAAFVALQKAAAAAGKVLEDVGQQLSNFYGSVKVASDILRQADELSSRFGFGRDAIVKSIDALRRAGMQGDLYMSAILNASAATGKGVEEISKELVELTKQSGDAMEKAIQKFSQEYDIEVRRYTNSAQLAEALNKRFAGAAANRATTVTGFMERISEGWKRVLETLGAPLGDAIKSVLEVILAFVNAIRQGVGEALESAKKSGELSSTLNDLRNATRRLLPLIAWLGHLVGKVLVGAVMWAIRAMKTLTDVFHGVLQRLKPLVDFIKNLIDRLKGLNVTIPDIDLAVFVTVARAIENFIKGFTEVPGKIKTAMEKTGDEVTKPLKSVAQELSTAGDDIARAISELIPKIRTAASNFWDDLAEMFRITPANIEKFGWRQSFKGLFVEALVALKFAFTEAFAGLGAALTGGESAIGKALAKVFSWEGMKGLLGGAFNAIKVGLKFLLVDLIGHIFIELFPIEDGIKNFLHKAFDVALWIAAIAPLARFIGPWGLVLSVILAVIIVFKDDILRIMQETWARLWPVLDIMRQGFEAGAEAWRGIFDRLGPLLQQALTAIGQAFSDFGTWVNTTLTDIGDFFSGFGFLANTLWTGLVLLFQQNVMPVLQGIFNNFAFVIGGAVQNVVTAWNLLKAVYDAVWPYLALVFKTLIVDSFLVTWELLVIGITSAINDRIIPAWQGIELVAKTIWGGLVTYFDLFIFTPLKNAFETIGRSIETVLRGIKKDFEDFSNWWRDHNPFQWMLDRIRDVQKAIESVRNLGAALRTVPGFGGGGGGVPSQQFGGVIPGRRGERRLVLAESGEQFLGSPTFAAGRPSNAGGGGTGGGITLNLNISNSVITNRDAMKELAREIGDMIAYETVRRGRLSIPPI
jgi:hypothetical protein